MPRKYVFADEGNFDFSAQGSRYFILVSITLDSCAVGDELAALRRELAWQGVELAAEFHATTDAQAVRDEVFAVIERHDFRVDATILEKAKTLPRLQKDETRFYQTAWFHHMKYITARITTSEDELLVVGASLGTNKKYKLFRQAISDVMGQTAYSTTCRTAAWSAASDPCLQVADYCCWAIQRKWERGDARSHVLIEDKIRTEFDLFRTSNTKYY